MGKTAGIDIVAEDPKAFLEYLRSHRLPVFHKSVLFFRDLQFGLWRFLQQSQTKVPYEKMEQLARELIDTFTETGLLKKIDAQTFELNLPEFAAAALAAAAADSTAPDAATTATEEPNAPAPPASNDGNASGDDKQAQIEALQRKMAEARAKRAESDSAPASETAPPKAAPSAEEQSATASSPAGDDKQARLEELQRKMAEAARKRQEATGQGPATTDAPASKPADAGATAGTPSIDEQKRARIQQLKQKMADAARKRAEAKGLSTPEASPVNAPTAEPPAPSPQGTASDDAAESQSTDDKQARIAELQRKMAEAKARREQSGGD